MSKDRAPKGAIELRRRVEALAGVGRVDLSVKGGRHAWRLVVLRLADGATKEFPVGSPAGSGAKRTQANAVAQVNRWLKEIRPGEDIAGARSGMGRTDTGRFQNG